MAIIKDKIIDLLNFRIKKEEESSRLYLSMSVWLNIQGFEGSAKQWLLDSNGELDHAKWAYDYLLSLNIKPNVPELKAPVQEFKSLPQIIALTYVHEIEVTEQCQALAKACMEENDYMTLSLAQKFLNEQAEEISKVTSWVDKLETFGESEIALRMLDDEFLSKKN
jgi:ferritin